MEQNTSQPPGISGPRLTLLTLIGLGLIGGCLSYTLWTYNRLDVARKARSESWRSLANELATRYRVAEKTVAAGVDSREIKMELGERFRLAIDQFRSTAQVAPQYDAAQKVEDLLADSGGTLAGAERDWIKPSSQLRSAIEDYNSHLANERQVLSSPGGRLLGLFLSFPRPEDFRVAAE